MKIDIWLSHNNKTQSDLARAIGVNRTKAHRLVKGQKPNDQEAIGIEMFTNGEVTPNDFYPLRLNLSKPRTKRNTRSEQANN